MPSSAYVHHMTPFIGATLFALACVSVDFAVRWRGRDSRGSALKEASANLPLVYIPVIGALALEGHYDTLYLACGIGCVIIEIGLFILLQEGPREVAKPLHLEKPQQSDPKALEAVPHATDYHGSSSLSRPTLLVGLHILAAVCFGIFWIWQPSRPPEQRSESVKATPPEARPAPGNHDPTVTAKEKAAYRGRIEILAPKPKTVKLHEPIEVSYPTPFPTDRFLWLIIRGQADRTKYWPMGICGGKDSANQCIDCRSVVGINKTGRWKSGEATEDNGFFATPKMKYTLELIVVDQNDDMGLTQKYKEECESEFHGVLDKDYKPRILAPLATSVSVTRGN
jgi:hypothetical protein